MEVLLKIGIVVLVGYAAAAWNDRRSRQKYGFPSLSVLIARLKHSKRFSWLAVNLWGDDDWYYRLVYGSVVGCRQEGK